MWDGTGKKTDSSRKRGRPATFPLRAVIPGFSDVMKTMVVGQMVRCWIPPRLGYKNRPGRPQGTLVFEIELLGIH
jgi:FKBP-type peptidyl-prolyl cis-trans isomerase